MLISMNVLGAQLTVPQVGICKSPPQGASATYNYGSKPCIYYSVRARRKRERHENYIIPARDGERECRSYDITAQEEFVVLSLSLHAFDSKSFHDMVMMPCESEIGIRLPSCIKFNRRAQQRTTYIVQGGIEGSTPAIASMALNSARQKRSQTPN